MNIFEKFDEKIGDDKYYEILHKELFSNGSPIANFPVDCITYRKNSMFSRVRCITNAKAQDLFNGRITKSEFYPPKKHIVNIPQGRFNQPNSRILYLADHPYIALKECNIEMHDFFLFATIKLSTDMHFLNLQKGVNRFTDMLYQLIHSTDTKFYSLINRITLEMLKYRTFHGIVYNSVKIQEGYEDNTWGKIPSSKNIAIYDEHIHKTELAAGWLCTLDDKKMMQELALFRPISQKKKNRLKCIIYSKNPKEFISETTKVHSQLNQISKHTETLLNMGYYSDPDSHPIKFIQLNN